MNDHVVVWGNCQAAPLADLLRAPLRAHGLRVAVVPPVYLVSSEELRRIYATMRKTAVFISQPVSDEYRQPGCGTAQLAALSPAGARIVRLPVVYDVAAFPFQVHGYDGNGQRVDAPVTEYHDLRILRGSAHKPPVAGLRAVAAESRAELRRRESGLDVIASDLLDAPDAMWTMTHPTNRVLARLARRVLAVLGLAGEVIVPHREYLGQRRAPLERAVVDALDWPSSAVRDDWLIDGAARPDVVAQQRAFYETRPDVVAATLRRAAARMALLGLD